MVERNSSVRPLGTEDKQDIIGKMVANELVSVAPDPQGAARLNFSNARGEVLGFVTARHALAKEVASGRKVLFARLTGFRQDGITIRVTTGDDADTLSKYTLEWHDKVLEHPSGRRSDKAYRQNIVGESYRQQAISRTSVGEAVKLVHDKANQHDARAVAVLNPAGDQLGFLPRGGWLTGVLIDDGLDVSARVLEIHQPDGARSHAAVVLEVVL